MMNMNRSIFITLLALSALWVSCDLYPQDEYEEAYVVEAYMVAQNTLPKVYVSRTAPVSDAYIFDDYAVKGANVEIRLLEDGIGSNIEQQFSYRMADPGIYEPEIELEVLPARTYQLNITFNNDPIVIQGYTTVPDTFSSNTAIPDTVIYQSPNQIELDITPSENRERQNYFIFTTIALDADIENFTPLYADFFDEEEDEINDFVKTSSGIVNEANFETRADGTINLKYPWIAVAFYGRNQIVANIIDDNLYDFVRSQAVQLGGSTLSPGEIPNLIYRLDNAVGVFGSIAADTIQTYIKRPQ